MLSNARSAAASRALAALAAEKETLTAQLTGPAPEHQTPTPAAPTAPAKKAAATSKARPPAGKASTAGDRTAQEPLLEVKPSPLNTDIEHLGEKVVILRDCVQVHDRSGKVLESIGAAEIDEVLVQKRFTGAAVTVTSTTGVTIMAKGLRPDQAEEMRTVIQQKLRRPQAPGQEPTTAGTAPAAAPPAPAAKAATAPAAAPARPEPAGRLAARPAATPAAPTAGTSAPTPAPTAARARRAPVQAPPQAVEGMGPGAVPSARTKRLVAMLDELHDAGILTDRELDEKRALVLRAATDAPVGSPN